VIGFSEKNRVQVYQLFAGNVSTNYEIAFLRFTNTLKLFTLMSNLLRIYEWELDAVRGIEVWVLKLLGSGLNEKKSGAVRFPIMEPLVLLARPYVRTHLPAHRLRHRNHRAPSGLIGSDCALWQR
jgi:hypothetical protein